MDDLESGQPSREHWSLAGWAGMSRFVSDLNQQHLVNGARHHILSRAVPLPPFASVEGYAWEEPRPPSGTSSSERRNLAASSPQSICHLLPKRSCQNKPLLQLPPLLSHPAPLITSLGVTVATATHEGT